ncbi:unnamed protein product [Phyllotreta striolata]|uniref:A-kinase anchor protein 2 C-terminal domain-containing protein n=1 Tax=Phyllotreta striolata TaxID=444603 RepID=A0A9P0GYT3_PHYSR|nr:unnamed protein product [Phyllotreta striolata]
MNFLRSVRFEFRDKHRRRRDMNGTGSTLERIQKEIQENIRREKELRRAVPKTSDESETTGNGTAKSKPDGPANSNGFTRRFVPNQNAKGLMQKFFKARGKVSSSDSPEPHNAGYFPLRFRVEKGKCLRNGYVPAEEKIVREVIDFQMRETELRNERMKSQPDLMAALELEEAQLNGANGVLKSAKSMTNLFQNEDCSKTNYSMPSR